VQLGSGWHVPTKPTLRFVVIFCRISRSRFGAVLPGSMAAAPPAGAARCLERTIDGLYAAENHYFITSREPSGHPRFMWGRRWLMWLTAAFGCPRMSPRAVRPREPPRW
jgi:hypothetical protein